MLSGRRARTYRCSRTGYPSNRWLEYTPPDLFPRMVRYFLLALHLLRYRFCPPWRDKRVRRARGKANQPFKRIVQLCEVNASRTTGAAMSRRRSRSACGSPTTLSHVGFFLTNQGLVFGVVGSSRHEVQMMQDHCLNRTRGCAARCSSPLQKGATIW